MIKDQKIWFPRHKPQLRIKENSRASWKKYRRYKDYRVSSWQWFQYYSG